MLPAVVIIPVFHHTESLLTLLTIKSRITSSSSTETTNQ